jgi:cytochrome c
VNRGSHVASHPIYGLPLAACLAFSAPAAASTADQAMTFAGRSAAHFREAGQERAFADFNCPGGGFADLELYVFCQGVSRAVVAHAGNPGIAGGDLSPVKDPGGRYPNVELNRMRLDDSAGCVSFRRRNPATKRGTHGIAHVIKADGQTVRGSRYHEP